MKFIKLLLALAAIMFLMSCGRAVTTPPEVFVSSNIPSSLSPEHVWVHGAWRWDKKAEVFNWRRVLDVTRKEVGSRSLG